MTIIHERADGTKVEYRVADDYGPGVFDLEFRWLHPDGRPRERHWRRVGDAHLLHLQKSNTGLVESLCDPVPWSPDGYGE